MNRYSLSILVVLGTAGVVFVLGVIDAYGELARVLAGLVAQ